MKAYVIDDIVTFEGKQWRVIDSYFELRKLARMNYPLAEGDRESFRNVPVYILDKEKEPEQRTERDRLLLEIKRLRSFIQDIADLEAVAPSDYLSQLEAKAMMYDSFVEKAQEFVEEWEETE